MSLFIYLVFGVISLIYGGINYYIGLHGWQNIFSYIPYMSGKVYWLVFWMISLSYLIGRIGERFLPAFLNHFLSIIGSYWLGFMFYSFLILLLLDLLRLFFKFFHLNPIRLLRSPVPGFIIFLFILGIIFYGAWNARHPVVHHYSLNIAKHAGNLTQLHIVMVSDIHLGTIMDDGRLSQMVKMVNDQHPDIILFAGDMIDENVERVIEQEMEGNLSNLKAKYGVYAILGNHEYIGGHVSEAIKYLQESGVTVLRDSAITIDHSINLIGRDDMSGLHFGKSKRAELENLMSSLNPSLPTIVLDHQPSHLEEPIEGGIDLQLSGHTHQGQMFPIQLITKRIFQDDFGLWQRGNFHIIVSSGFGTWGPPLRIGNKPEIVDLILHFET